MSWVDEFWKGSKGQAGCKPAYPDPDFSTTTCDDKARAPRMTMRPHPPPHPQAARSLPCFASRAGSAALTPLPPIPPRRT